MPNEAQLTAAPLALKALFTDFLINFPVKVKRGDTLKSNQWARELSERTERILQPIMDAFGLSIKSMGGVGYILTKNQYISFPKPPMSTNKGFYPYASFDFEKQTIELGIGESFDHEVPRSFNDVIRRRTDEDLPDFTNITIQGLRTKHLSLDQVNDSLLTDDLLRMVKTYIKCIDELGEEVDKFCRREVIQPLTEAQLDELIDAFIDWCKRNEDDEHLLAESPSEYAKWSKEYFSSLSIESLVDEVDSFVLEGGKLQSGGKRGGTRFRTGIKGREEEFRAHLLKVFEPDFDLHSWWAACDKFSRFGKGIRSIFLHRVRPNEFAVFNEKAEEGYRLFGLLEGRLNNSSESYLRTNQAAKALVARRPDELTFFRADHFDPLHNYPRRARGVDEPPKE